MSETTDVSQRGSLSNSLPFVSRVMICKLTGATTVSTLRLNDLPTSTKPSTSKLGTKCPEGKLALKPERSKSKEVSEWVSGTG